MLPRESPVFHKPNVSFFFDKQNNCKYHRTLKHEATECRVKIKDKRKSNNKTNLTVMEPQVKPEVFKSQIILADVKGVSTIHDSVAAKNYISHINLPHGE